jgi:hypothetical protein
LFEEDEKHFIKIFGLCWTQRKKKNFEKKTKNNSFIHSFIYVSKERRESFVWHLELDFAQNKLDLKSFFFFFCASLSFFLSFFLSSEERGRERERETRRLFCTDESGEIQFVLFIKNGRRRL